MEILISKNIDNDLKRDLEPLPNDGSKMKKKKKDKGGLDWWTASVSRPTSSHIRKALKSSYYYSQRLSVFRMPARFRIIRTIFGRRLRKKKKKRIANLIACF